MTESLSGGPTQQIASVDLPYPERFGEKIARYSYQGCNVAEIRLQAPVPPTLSFLTVDLKLPEDGEPRILEFNGVGSRLRTYPGGEIIPVTTIYEFLSTLEKPVYAHKGKKSKRLIAVGSDIAHEFGIHFDGDIEPFRQAKSDPTKPRDELPSDWHDVSSIIWRRRNNKGKFNPDVVSVNIDALTEIANSKLNLSEICRKLCLEFARPKSWRVKPKDMKDGIEYVLENVPDTERFILKPSTLSGGHGIVPVTREDLPHVARDIAKGKMPDPKSKNYKGGWLVEEYVASKPVRSSHDQLFYDGTSRVVVLMVTSGTNLALIPVCGYWKLPPEPVGHDWSRRSTVSNVHRPGASERMCEEDFGRAFTTITKVLPPLVEHLLREPIRKT